jgi:hypothetical protein
MNNRLLIERNRLETFYIRRFARALRQQAAPTIRALRELPAELVLSQLPQLVQPDIYRETLTECYNRVGVRFSQETRTELIKKARKDIALDEGWNEYFNQFIAPVLNRNTAKKVTRVTQTNIEILQRAIGAGINEGLGIDKIAAQVRNVFEEATQWRSRMIAQTEVISASNQAAYAGAQSAGIEYKKFWSNSGLEGVRESHIFAQEWSYGQDGINPNELFDMGNGNYLMHPGDPEGAVEEIVNCRCTLIVEPI